MTGPAAAEAPSQLDLFIDGRDALLIHEVVTALVARDTRRAEAGLAQLETEHSAHPDLPALILLAGALRAPLPPSPSHAALAARIEEIERCLAPPARLFLGAAKAASFLEPLWQALATGAAAMAFDEAHPRAHPGWLWQQCSDWAAVRAAIEGERDWKAQPLLRLWMGLAHHHLGESEAALRLWLPLCWVDPALFARHAPGLPSAPVREAWTAFERAALFGETWGDPASTAAWFPAWLLARHRGLAQHFRADDIPDAGAPTRAFRALLSLLPLEGGALTDEVVRQRRSLQQISPGFFRTYLEAGGRRRAGA